MRVAVAGVPGAWSSELLATSLRAAGAEAFVFSLGDTAHDLGSGMVQWQGCDLGTVDAIAVKKLADQSDAWGRLRLHALRALQAQGVQIFSSPEVIDIAMDRYRMMMDLAEAGLPIPETIAAESDAALKEAIAKLGDCVVKPVYTSKGRGMMRIDGTREDAIAELQLDEHHRYLVQRFVEAPGRDIGATVVGGTFVGAFYRVANEGAWMTTTDAGGRYAPCALSSRGIAYAERAARVFSLDYTVVDLVEQGDDFLLYEVSAFGGFRGLYEACGIDSSIDYARHIIRVVEAR